MNTFRSTLQSMRARWHAEDLQVLGHAAAANMRRLRILCPVGAVLNAVHVVIFLTLLQDPQQSQQALRWKTSLIVAHASMGVLMLLCGWLAWRLHRQPGSTANSQRLSAAVFAVVMAFSVTVVTVDQWVTPNITPFLIPCVLAGLAIYLRPATVVWIYALGYIGFWVGMGWTQDDVNQLASNRLNGISASVMGCLISILLWRNFATIQRQQSQLEKAYEELKQLAHLDGLTGLYNRNTLIEFARMELTRAQRAGTATTVLLMDLDHFKEVNDRWGHPAGDAVLRHVAQLATATVRNTDLVGRLGGEEFIIVLPATHAEAGHNLAEKLRGQLERSSLVWQGQTIAMTASLGVASTTPAQKMDFERLYASADAALYEAKNQGRNRVVRG